MITPQTELTAFRHGREIFRGVFPPGDYLIGREGDVPILLPSEKVSRRHAQLILSYFDWMIEDLGSSNGTRVGGAKVTEATLIFPRQDVSVGDVELHLRRVTVNDAGESLAPQAAALHQFLPEAMRGQAKYKIHGLIATGGMGVVLEAEDLSTLRRVAMKVLLHAKTPEHVARFIEEAQVTAQLDHPNIVPIYELNANELDKPFYTMKLVRGTSLKELLQTLRTGRTEVSENYPLSTLLSVLLRVCDAIAFAHSKGVVHRDLKPDNIMVGDFGDVLVMDWGLAKPLGQSAHGGDASVRTMVRSLRRDESAPIETIEGMSLGTPAFMSPEQASGHSHAADARADIYALGAILYNILTLKPPIDGADAHETMEKVVTGNITPPHEAITGRKLVHLEEGRLPEPLVRTALKAMSLKPADRHPTVRHFQTEVRAFQLGDKKKLPMFGIDRIFGGRHTRPLEP